MTEAAMTLKPAAAMPVEAAVTGEATAAHAHSAATTATPVEAAAAKATCRGIVCHYKGGRTESYGRNHGQDELTDHVMFPSSCLSLHSASRCVWMHS
jgi:hypothetical protein